MHIELLVCCFQSGANISEEYLTSLVYEHNAIIYQLSADNKPKFRCKLHYLTHYPRLMKHYGCLKLYWTMRFEGMHKIFKGIILRSHQYKNVAFSCASRYQMHQAVSLESRNDSTEFSSADVKLQAEGDALIFEEVAALNMYFSKHLDFDDMIIHQEL